MALRAVTEPTKVCAGPCGERKPWSDFHAKVKWSDGTMRQPQSRCKDCRRIASRTTARQRRKGPNFYAERYALETARLDAVKLARRRKRQREYRQRRFGHTPRPELWQPLVVRRRPRTSTASVPTESAAPFMAWLRTLGTTSTEIARVTGMRDDRVRQYLAGNMERVSLDVVDRACLHADADLNEIYPLEVAA